MERDRKRLGFTLTQIRESTNRGLEKGVNREQSYLLAHVFSVARMKANLTVEELAEKSGVSLNDLIDFELRQLHKYESTKIAAILKETLGVNDLVYRLALLDSGKN